VTESIENMLKGLTGSAGAGNVVGSLLKVAES
jgi:hypothetical protein